MTIGEYIKTRRAECGWSLDDLAARSGIVKSVIWHIESEDTSPTLSTLEDIARAFDMGAGDMLVEAGYTLGARGNLPRKTLTITVDITGYVTHREERIDTHHD